MKFSLTAACFLFYLLEKIGFENDIVLRDLTDAEIEEFPVKIRIKEFRQFQRTLIAESFAGNGIDMTQHKIQWLLACEA